MEDEEEERFEHTMTPERVSAVFDDMKEMIRTTKERGEIDAYLRSLVKDLIIITHPMYPMDRIFSIIDDKITRIIEESQGEFFPKETGDPLIRAGNIVSLWTHWTRYLRDLMLSSSIRSSDPFVRTLFGQMGQSLR